jgi:hypothetical protein
MKFDIANMLIHNILVIFKFYYKIKKIIILALIIYDSIKINIKIKIIEFV